MITMVTTINAPITIKASPNTRPSIIDRVDEPSLELLSPVELPARIVVVTVTVAMERILVLVVVTMEMDVVVTVVTLVEVTGGLVRVTVVVPLPLARDGQYETHVHVTHREGGGSNIGNVID